MATFITHNTEFLRAMGYMHNPSPNSILTVIEVLGKPASHLNVLKKLTMGNPPSDYAHVVRDHSELADALVGPGFSKCIVLNVADTFDWATQRKYLKAYPCAITMLVRRTRQTPTNEISKFSDIHIEYDPATRKFTCLKHTGIPSIMDNYCFGY